MTLGYHSLGQGDEKILFLHGWLSDHLAENADSQNIP